MQLHCHDDFVGILGVEGEVLYVSDTAVNSTGKVVRQDYMIFTGFTGLVPVNPVCLTVSVLATPTEYFPPDL